MIFIKYRKARHFVVQVKSKSVSPSHFTEDLKEKIEDEKRIEEAKNKKRIEEESKEKERKDQEAKELERMREEKRMRDLEDSRKELETQSLHCHTEEEEEVRPFAFQFLRINSNIMSLSGMKRSNRNFSIAIVAT